MKRTLLVIGMLLVVPATAAADRLTNAEDVPGMPTTREVVMDGLTVMTRAFAKQVNSLSFDLVKLDFDPRTQTGFLKFHGELGEATYLAIHSDVHVMGRVTRFKTSLFIGLFGSNLHLDLPEIDLVRQSGWGRQYVELRVPLLYRRF